MVRRVRLTTGLVLFAYVATHLLNHTLGLVSLEAMETGRGWFLTLWRNPVGTAALYASLVIHFGLALWAIYIRRRMDYSFGEAAQLILGISIPALLALHFVGSRGAHELAGTNDTYTFVLLAQFKFSTVDAVWRQGAGLLAAWIHGCIGLTYWLRLKPFFPHWRFILFAAALLLPVLALLGYIDAGRAVLALAESAEWRRAALAAIHPPDRAAQAVLLAIRDGIWWAVGGGVAMALAARVIRQAAERNRNSIRITYPDGRGVSIPPGTTILEASRLGAIPHAAVCGGRRRCSTCRVRVTDGADALPAPSAEEQKVLDRIEAPPHVRLACQTRPAGDVSVMPLLPPTATAREGFARPGYLRGQEREIAILFADLRDFTRFSERKLPYDVVFVLNRYFAGMGAAVEGAGGHLDKFIGDGVMALFGIETDIAVGCRQVINAARLMGERLEELNRSLEHDLDEPLRIGIGIHVGHAIIGEMGYGQATSLTAVGDAVNTASRIEAMTKEYKAQLVLSEDVATRAGIDLDGFTTHELPVRGRMEPIRAVVKLRTSDLTEERLAAAE
jgi:adenylate cyclase